MHVAIVILLSIGNYTANKEGLRPRIRDAIQGFRFGCATFRSQLASALHRRFEGVLHHVYKSFLVGFISP